MQEEWRAEELMLLVNLREELSIAWLRQKNHMTYKVWIDSLLRCFGIEFFAWDWTLLVLKDGARCTDCTAERGHQHAQGQLLCAVTKKVSTRSENHFRSKSERICYDFNI